MKYESVVLSDLKKRNRKSFRSFAVATIIICIVMTIVLMWQDPGHMLLVGMVMPGAALFVIVIWAAILFSGITYTALKNESNHFDVEKLKLIDEDYMKAAVFKNHCRVGELYVYGYYREGFVMIPIRQIESVHAEYSVTKPVGHMVILCKKNTKVRSMIGAFEHKEDAQRIVDQIAERNDHIKVK